MGLERIRIVLVRPRSAGNVGAAARAMKNMALERLVLVAPARFDHVRAAARAVHATDVLEGRSEVGSLAEAVAGCGLVVGTSGRRSTARSRATDPRRLAPEIGAAAAANDVALVFGPEHHGLSNDELALCQRVMAIPASPAYGSLNLSQAVLVCAYEVFLASAAPEVAARVLAASERHEAMFARLETSLRAIGFLHRENAAHMMRALRRILGRAALDEHEVRILLGVARQIAWCASRAGTAPQGNRHGGPMDAPAT
jgi:TrmH family RNA methyltransferase